MDRKMTAAEDRAQHLALTGITAISWKWIHKEGCTDSFDGSDGVILMGGGWP